MKLNAACNYAKAGNEARMMRCGATIIGARMTGNVEQPDTMIVHLLDGALSSSL